MNENIMTENVKDALQWADGIEGFGTMGFVKILAAEVRRLHGVRH